MLYGWQTYIVDVRVKWFGCVYVIVIIKMTYEHKPFKRITNPGARVL